MRLKKIFIAMLSLAMLFALCACDSEEQLTGGYLNKADLQYVQEADDDLLERGYPQEFVSQAGSCTKVELVNRFQTYYQTSEESASGEVEGLSASLTVSDIPVAKSDIAAKMVTFVWKWDSERLADDETITFDWDNADGSFSDQYMLLPTYTLFELCGAGTLTESDMFKNSEGIPETATGTILLKAGYDNVFVAAADPGMQADAALTQVIDSGFRVSHTFGVTREMRFSVHYGDAEDGTNRMGAYAADPDHYWGSYSILLVKKVNEEDIGKDLMHTLTATYRHGEEEQSVSCTFTDFLETA